MDRIFNFGPFQLDPHARLLTRDCRRLSVTPRLFDTLRVLVENHGKVVSKDELMREVWPDVSVGESNLTQTIHMLRKLLGEKPNENCFIATVPGRGYSFVARVRDLESPAIAPNVRGSSPRRWTLAAGATVAGVLALTATLNLEPPEPAWRLRPLTTSPGSEDAPSFSPDGREVVFAGSDPEEKEHDLFIKNIDSGVTRRLTRGPERDWSPAWSPDGSTIAFYRSGPGEDGLWRVPARGGDAQWIASTAQVSFRGPGRRLLAWLPDSNGLVISNGDLLDEPLALYRLTFDGQRERLTTPPALSAGDFDPAVSSDGELLAFVRIGANNTGTVMVMPARGGTPRQTASNPGRLGGLAWTAGGRELVYSSTHAGGSLLYRMAVSGGESRRLSLSSHFALEPAISRQGGRLAYRDVKKLVTIRRVRPGGVWEIVRSSTKWMSGAQYSPDGKRIAFSSIESGSSEIWVCDAEGRGARQLTHLGGPVAGSPRWSPDGKLLAFDAAVNGNTDIFVVPETGGEPRPITTHSAEDAVPSWSRSGRWIYFASSRSGSWQVWKAGVESGEQGAAPLRVTSNGGFLAQESPDGQWVYYAKGRSEPGLWRIRDGSAERVTDRLCAGCWGWWQVTPKGIYYLDQAPPGAPVAGYIKLIHSADSREQIIAAAPRLPFRGVPALSAGPDWDRFLFPLLESSTSDLMLVEDFR